jgi:hypothetical protein
MSVVIAAAGPAVRTWIVGVSGRSSCWRGAVNHWHGIFSQRFVLGIGRYTHDLPLLPLVAFRNRHNLA